MNLSAGASAHTVEALASQIDEEADPACHSYPRVRVNEPRRIANLEKAPVNHHGHRKVNRTHSSVLVVAQYTCTAHDAPRRAIRARHPEPVSVFIHIV